MNSTVLSVGYTTSLYLEKLRQGDYLFFLQWIDFLMQYYPSTNAADINTENLYCCVTYEMIQHKFSEDDIKKVALLLGLLNEPVVLHGHLVYRATIICSAAMQYYVYLKKDLLKNFNHNKAQTLTDVVTCMGLEIKHWPGIANSEALDEAQSLFNGWLVDCSIQIKQAKAYFNDIFQMRATVIAYQQRFIEAHPLLAASESVKLHISIIGALSERIETLTQLDEVTLTFIQGLINTLRNSMIEEWEQDYLARILPRTLWQQIGTNATTLISSVFNTIFPFFPPAIIQKTSLRTSGDGKDKTSEFFMKK